jgi:hypothetical protein
METVYRRHLAHLGLRVYFETMRLFIFMVSAALLFALVKVGMASLAPAGYWG